MRLSAVILAGGRSQRMGRDKALLPVAGHTTALARQIELLSAMRPIEILISCRPEQALPLPRTMRRIHDDGTRGPLGGIAAALRSARGDAILVLGVDLVRMSAHLLRRIVGSCEPDGSIGAIPFLRGRADPLASVLPITVAGVAEAQLQSLDLSLQAFSREAVSRKIARWFEVPEYEAGAFTNWNRRADVLPPLRNNN